MGASHWLQDNSHLERTFFLFRPFFGGSFCKLFIDYDNLRNHRSIRCHLHVWCLLLTQLWPVRIRFFPLSLCLKFRNSSFLSVDVSLPTSSFPILILFNPVPFLINDFPLGKVRLSCQFDFSIPNLINCSRFIFLFHQFKKLFALVLNYDLKLSDRPFDLCASVFKWFVRLFWYVIEWISCFSYHFYLVLSINLILLESFSNFI